MRNHWDYLRHGRLSPLRQTSEGCRRETVILVHGLMHRGVVMVRFGELLGRHGYRVYAYDYPTRSCRMREHGERFRAYLRRIAAILPPEQRKIHIVSHSMGGLIVRYALGDETVIPPEKRGKLLFLAVPHGGSPVAARWVDRLPRLSRALVRPLPELSDRHGELPELPYPAGWHIGSLIGRFDSRVPEASTAYPGEADRVVIDAGHAFIMNQPEAGRLALRFLKDGVFCPPPLAK